MDDTSLSIVASSEAGLTRELAVSLVPEGVLEDEACLKQWAQTLNAEHVHALARESEFRVGDLTDRTLFSLRTRQIMAFRAIIEGESIAAAARAAGVGRTTVHRWMKEDPNFKAALARHAQEQESMAREHLRSSVEAAARNVHQAVKQGHLAASLNVLRNAGLMGSRPAPEPRAGRAVDQRAALALEARLGQLLSMLAQHPAIAGLPSEAEQIALVPREAQIDGSGGEVLPEPASAEGTPVPH